MTQAPNTPTNRERGEVHPLAPLAPLRLAPSPDWRHYSLAILTIIFKNVTNQPYSILPVCTRAYSAFSVAAARGALSKKYCVAALLLLSQLLERPALHSQRRSTVPLTQKLQLVMIILVAALVGSIWLGDARADASDSTAKLTVSEPMGNPELRQESNSTVPAQPTSETPSTSGETTENPAPVREDEPHTTPSSQETPTKTETPATPETPSQPPPSDQQYSKMAKEIPLFALAGIIALGGAVVLHKMTRGLI